MQATDAPTHVSPAQLASELLEFWTYLMKGGSRRVYQLLGELDLSLTQVKALHALDDNAGELPCSVKDLAEDLGLSLPGASRTVETLLRKGYLERTEDEHDRRIKRVRITPRGRDAVHRIEGARLTSLEEYTAAMTPEQREQLHAALEGLPHRLST
jgi:DNA-binding MarR family transcriptional regulator